MRCAFIKSFRPKTLGDLIQAFFEAVTSVKPENILIHFDNLATNWRSER